MTKSQFRSKIIVLNCFPEKKEVEDYLEIQMYYPKTTDTFTFPNVIIASKFRLDFICVAD